MQQKINLKSDNLDSSYLNQGLSSIRCVHIEATSYCNASCSMCSRTQNQLLALKHLDFDVIRAQFNPAICAQLNEMYLCGNFGDPVMHPQCLDIVDYFSSNGTKYVSLHTNGSIQSVEWWRELAKTMRRPKGWVHFSIDGLSDTNHIYREGTSWEKIIRNAEAFINAGGVARWNFIVFQHNEHQVEEARSLAEKMGFSRFVVKGSYRFRDNLGQKFTTKIKPAENKNYQNQLHSMLDDKKLDSSAIEITQKLSSISCSTREQQSLYIGFDGRVYPCCWIGGATYSKDEKKRNDLHAFCESLGYEKDFNSLHQHDLNSILHHPFFKKDLVNSWNDSAKRLSTCAFQCASKLKFSESQKLSSDALVSSSL